MPDSTLSTLEQIIEKVRLLTKSLSPNQITDDQIKEYINTFVLYDFPAEVQTVTLKKNLTFYTQPYVESYGENTIVTTDPLYNFNNKYLSFHAPVYFAGVEGFFTQSEEQFNRLYPQVVVPINVGTGDGANKTFSGTISGIPFLRNTFVISSITTQGLGIVGIDVPMIDPTTGNPLPTGYVVNQANSGDIFGTVNYITGAYNVVFSTAPADTQPVYAQYAQYQASIPRSILFFDNKFVIRPVPDKSYAVQVVAMQRPTELLSTTTSPEVASWFQYIAYGAAIKIFEDRTDLESKERHMPEFQKQKMLVLRKSTRLRSNQRSATLYSAQAEDMPPGSNGGWWRW